MYDDEWFYVKMVGALVVVFGLCVWLVTWDAKRWAAYAAEHHCERTGETRQSWYWVSTGNNSGYMQATTEYEYACDANEIVWR